MNLNKFTLAWMQYKLFEVVNWLYVNFAVEWNFTLAWKIEREVHQDMGERGKGGHFGCYVLLPQA